MRIPVVRQASTCSRTMSTSSTGMPARAQYAASVPPSSSGRSTAARTTVRVGDARADPEREFRSSEGGAVAHEFTVEAVTAVIVPKAGHTLTEAQVLAHAALHLAHFKCPKGVVFVDALPKNPSGKLLKRSLRQQFERHFDAA